jgi:hypothetical protein
MIVAALVASAVVVLILILTPAQPGPAEPAVGRLPTSAVHWEPDPCRSAMRGPC